MSKVPFRITLLACRINKGYTQQQAVNAFYKYSDIKIGRQTLAKYENDPTTMPHLYARVFSSIYGIPMDYINFVKGSTASLMKGCTKKK